MRIVFVPGIVSPAFYQSGWKRDLKRIFPQEKVVIEQVFYLHFQYSKIEGIVERGRELLEDEMPTIILAHSFGGILAKLMLKRAKKHKVDKLVTMASPHQMEAFGLKGFKSYFGVPEEVSGVEMITFGGHLDPIVPCPLTRTAHSRHQDFWCGHAAFLHLSSVRRRVLREAGLVD
jgi:predicted alpha/beta hydrolase family esterase